VGEEVKGGVAAVTCCKKKTRRVVSNRRSDTQEKEEKKRAKDWGKGTIGLETFEISPSRVYSRRKTFCHE